MCIINDEQEGLMLPLINSERESIFKIECGRTVLENSNTSNCAQNFEILTITAVL